jgi:hypothetical protein
MTWIKCRSTAYGHRVNDTTRGASKFLATNSTAAEDTNASVLTAFTSSGFSVGASTAVNESAATYVSWTFRKQPKFFDVVTYTGTGAVQNIAHSLGSVPGCIIVKRTDSSSANWYVYHQSLGNATRIFLNLTDASSASTDWNSTTPTATQFTVSANNAVNGSGGTFVAYLFAHNAGGFGLTGTDNVISCGSFTSDGTNFTSVDLGYEPQFVLAKMSSGESNWWIFDNMRGIPTGSNDPYLLPNTSGAEATNNNWIDLTSTGFRFNGAPVGSGTLIYIAIRRGPMKVPTSGTSVFSPNISSSSGGTITTNFPVDLSLNSARASSSHYSMDRLRGASTNFYNVLVTNTTAAEDIGTGAGLGFDNNTGFVNSWSGSSYVWWNFRRAPSFFDEVCYTGTGSATTFTHNLGVAPELMIVKQRSSTTGWVVYVSALAASDYLVLNNTSASQTASTIWNSTAPTSSVFSVGTSTTTNTSAGTYVNYLFATCAGVSKVGEFSHLNGTATDVNCGFTAGARFVLFKRYDGTGDWYVWDSARGIVSGNDPYLLLNSTAAEVTNTDFIDPLSSGFQVSSSFGAVGDRGFYIFLAIA